MTAVCFVLRRCPKKARLALSDNNKEHHLLKLFFAPGSCSLASHIALEEVGAEYEAILVDFRTEEQTKPEYLAINPKGRVPALVTGDGIITENPAILTYIASAFPDGPFAQIDDPFAMAKVASLNAYISSTVHVAHAHRFRGYRWADDTDAIAEMSRKAPEVVAKSFEMIEKELFTGPWATGHSYTIADPYLYTVATWMEFDEVDLAKVPRLVEFRDRMSERLAVQRALDAQKG